MCIGWVWWPPATEPTLMTCDVTRMAADTHRPHDFATLRVAAQELRSLGLTPRDIACALRLTEAAVLELLASGMETQL